MLNHLPIAGVTVCVLALALAMAFRNRTAQVVALLVTFITALSILPVTMTGDDAAKAIRGVADDGGIAWLEAHADRADTAEPFFYVLAGFALAALMLPIKWPRSAFILNILTLALAIVCVGMGGWVAQAGGQIRHPEFRVTQPPPSESKTPQ